MRLDGVLTPERRRFAERVGRRLVLTLASGRLTYLAGDRRERRRDRRQLLALGIAVSLGLGASFGPRLALYGVPFFVAQFVLLEWLERPGDRAEDEQRAARREAYREARRAAGFLPANPDERPDGG